MSSVSESSQPFQSPQVQDPLPTGSGPSLPDAELLHMTTLHDTYIPSSPPQDADSNASDSAADPQSPDLEGNEDDPMEDVLDEAPPRPNRYDGPKSTYRTYTRAERRLDETMNKIRSQDLSIHLYNAHAFKQRVRATNSIAKFKPTKGKGKRNAEADSSFIPPSYWAAWPMPPDEVPREGEKVVESKDEEWTFKMDDDPRPSAVLEDCLIAEVGKAARKRLEMREWEGGILGLVHSDSDSSSVADEGAESKMEDEGGKKGPMKLDVDTVAMRPILLADEDKIRRIARPEVRRILERLDDLLQSLHDQRAAYSLVSKGSSSNTDDERLRPDKKKKVAQLQISETKRKPLAGKSNKQTRAPSQPSGDESSHSDNEPSRPTSTAASTTTHPGSRSSSKRRHDQQNPRDWSDVLGMAALTGWSPAVIARAGKRCADLFGEDMQFRSLDEVTPTPSIQSFTASKPFVSSPPGDDLVDPARVPIPTDEEGALRERYVYDPPDKDELFCPVFPCKNYNTAFRRTGFSSIALRDAHIRATHPRFKTPQGMDREGLYGGVHLDGYLEAVRPREGFLGRKGEKEDS